MKLFFRKKTMEDVMKARDAKAVITDHFSFYRGCCIRRRNYQGTDHQTDQSYERTTYTLFKDIRAAQRVAKSENPHLIIGELFDLEGLHRRIDAGVAYYG